jgi:hypothetical protein
MTGHWPSRQFAGEQAGFCIEQMIQLLNADVSLETLLQMIALRLEREARSPMPPFGASSRWIV